MGILDIKDIPRPEYPRPQFVRKDNWINLNGEWDFAFDDNNLGIKERWYKNNIPNAFDKKIIVPFCFQSKLSGIEDTSFHDIVWYRRKFSVPRKFLEKKVLLHFGAVNYFCNVYINGECVGSHSGGFIGFTLDISDFIEKYNVIVLRVENPSVDLEIPRGKQYWEENLNGIFYQRVTGIWQTVWLEYISSDYFVKQIKFTPDIDRSQIFIDCEMDGIGFSDLTFSIEIYFKDKKINEKVINLDFLGKSGEIRDRNLERERREIPIPRWFNLNPNRFKLRISIPENLLYLWDVDNPNLYDVNLKVYNKKSMESYDEVTSYFGMRKISISEKPKNMSRDGSSDRQVLLNNKPLYQKLFLVQGYWPTGLYTAPSDEDIKLDIQYIIDFGFNGLRTHQKAFDPRFLYWCDKMGVLVWGEIGNAYRFSVKSQLNIINEFVAEVERDYNHPSIIVWTVLNEGWGVPRAYKDQRKVDYTASLYHLIKSIDPTRLIIDDDGWWHVKTDLCTVHFYLSKDLLPNNFDDEKSSFSRGFRIIYLKSFRYRDEPIIYSEIGGYGFDLHGNLEKKWGYGHLIKSKEDLFNRILELLKEFDKRKAWVHGFCYTELYDQFQEINGLLTMDRTPKFPPEWLKKELDNMFY
ncbi:MAG: glycoside hydrolase family 2 protein [Promethearchaeota archaeon]